MKNLVVYDKCIKSFFAKKEYINSTEQLIKECNTIEEAGEIAHHLNKVLRGERFPFNSYSVVYGKGVEMFFVIDGTEISDCKVLIETFETLEEAINKRDELNKMNKGK
jgi:hypothetical protein